MNYTKGEMNIHSLFPTAIGETVRSVTSEEQQFFAELLNKPVKENIGNTFTEDNHVLDNTRLSNLKNDLTDITNEYFQKVYRPTNDVEIYITISWVNYTKQGEFHHNHCHGNSIISGVYYIDTDDDDTITFETPFKFLSGFHGLKIKAKDYNLWNSEEWWFKTPKNNVLLFPSSMMHRVDSTTNKGVRTSLAFNTFIKGTINTGLVELTL